MSEIFMSETYGQFLQSLDPPQETYVSKLIQHYVNEYRRALVDHDGPTVAHNFHRLIDEQLQQSLEGYQGPRITCKKGCHHCCLIHVDITQHEAQLLIQQAEEMGIQIDWSRLWVQSRKNVTTWAELTQAQARCTFLDHDGSCRVYEYRPSYCRLHTSTDLRKHCRVYGKKIRTYFAYLPETIAVAMHNCIPGDGMARMLLENRK